MKDQRAEKLARTVVLMHGAAKKPKSTPLAGLSVVPVQQVLAPGTCLDHYVIDKEAGVGGMGVVYKAHDTLLDRKVAIKVLPPNLCQNAEFVRRFAKEAQVQARIDSPYIVTLHALMEKNVGLVLVMDYLEGETLEQRLRRQGTLSVTEAIDLFAQASVGVEHIHRTGIVHQDLKPANMFITVHGRLKLLDFGVAKLMHDQSLAQGGAMMGTLLYMSPEQIKGRAVDYRSDVYTLGISLFEAVAGRLPFERKTNYGLMHAHVQENPPPPSKYQTDIPRELEKVILKAIAKEPDRRFQTIVEFRKALLRHRKVKARQFQPARAALPAPHGRSISGRRRRILGGFGFVLAGIVALGGFLSFYWYQSNRAPETTAVQSASQEQTLHDKYAPLRKAWGNQER